MVGYPKQGNKPSSSAKGGKFFNQLNDFQLIQDSAPQTQLK
jgi:hypothetical protein